ncbi:hypothetical protein HK100_007698 [Physocladia obscura]|uniref:Uncharacterized protein n=1 Tax=Physocladia obscura TaxID=109957 RepID=A0AAD5X849_9FUNG|nr:hypothetical protein HK100_007698 [Physocladia obscura]
MSLVSGDSNDNGGCPFMSTEPTSAGLAVSTTGAIPSHRSPVALSPILASPGYNRSTRDSAALNSPTKRSMSVSSSGSKSGGKNKSETQLRLTVARKNMEVNNRLNAVHRLFQGTFILIIA